MRATSMVIAFRLACVVVGVTDFILHKSATCDEEKIHFTLTFAQPFNGVIYSDGHYGNPRCTYVNETSATRYDFAIPTDHCRPTTTSSSSGNGSASQHQLIVQRDPNILSGQDQLLYIICLSAVNAKLHASFIAPSVINFNGVKVDLKLDSQSAVRANMATNVNYTAEIRAADTGGRRPFGPAVQGDLNVGQPLSYVANVRGVTHAPLHVRMGRCWAHDEYSNVSLSDDDGCPMEALKNYWGPFRMIKSSENDVTFYNNMKAWAFPTSNRLNIMCNLHFCSAPCVNKCAPPSASGRSSASATTLTQE